MASTPKPDTPQLDTRSPLTKSLLNIVPKEHEKAIKQAFYNTAANIFVLLACAAAVAVYFILEAFLKPLLWAVLCGAFLNPFKRSLTNVLRNWLNGLNASGTPFLVGLVVTPIKCADKTADYVYNSITQNLKLVLGLLSAIIVTYVLWHFGPLWSIFGAMQSIFLFTYNLVGYFSSFWIWTVAIAYFIALLFFWNEESEKILKPVSILVWLVLILHVAAAAGPLRVPLLMLIVATVTVGFIAETKEALRRQERTGQEENRKSIFEEAMKVLMGEPKSPDKSGQSEEAQEDQPKKPAVTVETLGTLDRPISAVSGASAFKSDSRPDSLPGVLRRKPPMGKLVTPSAEVLEKPKNHSDQCFIALLWGHVLARLWLHIWLIMVLLPLPLGIWVIKKLGYALSSSEGPLGNKVMSIRRSLGTWIRNRKEVLMPKWLRGVARLIMKGDQKLRFTNSNFSGLKLILVISAMESSLDNTTSILFILLLLLGSVLFSIIFAVQVQQESMYIVKTTSSLLNNTLHPEMGNWLPNNDDLQNAMDSMVGNAYHYGRNWIASKVKDLVNDPSDKNSHIENQVLEMWDRLYESWLARNATSTSVVSKSGGPMAPFDITNLTSVWTMLTEGDGFKVGDIVDFVKENIGTFVSVLESIWLVLKSNMNLVITVLTSTLSLVFGGGTALLNFVISSVIFLTTMFYLLASSGDQYKPIEWFASMSPATGGNTFGQAVQDAVGGVFMASLKMALFYGLYTWLTHLVFGVNIVFIPSALAAIFAAIPFVGTYLAAIPAVLELWLVQDRFFMAILLFVCHFLPAYVVDTAIYSEIKGGHPYVTGLAIAGGMYWLGLEGAIFGPIILCCLIVLVNVYSTMIRPESPAIQRSQSVI